MKTPCQSDPELWVSERPEDRAEAARACHTCPVEAFQACERLAADTRPDMGVYAGEDYHHRKYPAGEVKTCAQCGETFHRDKSQTSLWAKRRYCSRRCYGAARTSAVSGLSKACEQCGVVFAKASNVTVTQFEGRRFCSMACSGEALSAKAAARRLERAS
jgi:hypothetical protein